jgi:hypothetical protein
VKTTFCFVVVVSTKARNRECSWGSSAVFAKTHEDHFSGSSPAGRASKTRVFHALPAAEAAAEKAAEGSDEVEVDQD